MRAFLCNFFPNEQDLFLTDIKSGYCCCVEMETTVEERRKLWIKCILQAARNSSFSVSESDRNTLRLWNRTRHVYIQIEESTAETVQYFSNPSGRLFEKKDELCSEIEWEFAYTGNAIIPGPFRAAFCVRSALAALDRRVDGLMCLLQIPL